MFSERKRNSDIKNKIILGTAQMGMPYGINNIHGKPSELECNLMLTEAWCNELKLIDTAESYGNAQELIGGFHNRNPDKKFKVITKLMPNKNVNDVESSVMNDLSILGINCLYGFMFHSYESFNLNKKSLKVLSELKSNGFVQKIGVSVYDNSEIELLLNVPEIDFVQLPFNMLDNWSMRGASIRELKKAGKEVHARSSFLQGLFFKDPSVLPDMLYPLKKYLEILRVHINDLNISIEEAALSYVLSKDEIDHVLIGAETVQQVRINAAILNSLKIDSLQFNEIDKILVSESHLLSPVNWK
jgi:uncharacterized protein